jgi:apolipoprotein N-acyltransferase
MRAGFPGWRALCVPVVAGLAMALGQAPLGWVAVAFPALIFYIHAVVTAEKGTVWLAWFGGAAYFAAALSWIVSPFLVDPVRYAWMAPFALIGMAFGLALFWALAAWLASFTRHRALGFAVALAGVELARGTVLTGFPWALIGHIWADTPMAQLVAVLGPNGLSLLTTLVAALPVMFGLRALPAIAAVGMASLVWAEMRLDGPDPATRVGTLRLVQPNAEQHLKWDPDQARILFDRQVAMTAVQPVADLTIWPETALPYLIDRDPQVGRMIADAAQGHAVIVGMQRVEGTQGWNTMAVIGADGAVTQSYDKWHLVPFGEYIPFGDLAYRWFGLRAFASQVGNGYAAGVGPAVMDLGAMGKILPLICYEAVFPQDVRAAPERADWILQITNDAWFGTLTGPWQHLAQARLRAIEQGLPLVRVANTGMTAVIDAKGRVVQELDFGVAAYLDVPGVPGALPPTPYARFGEVPVLLLLGGLAAGLIVTRRPKAA